MPKTLEKTTFTLTEKQINWIAEQSRKTGLLKSEIVRRAIDLYTETEDRRTERQLFTLEQRKEIRHIAQVRGISEEAVIRRAIDRELNRYQRT